MKTMIVKNNWMPSLLNAGWGNGYVLIPEGHKLHGAYMGDLELGVHGGITFSELVTEKMLSDWKVEHSLTKEDIGMWLIGFDTAHAFDTIDKWPQEAVQEETNRLAEIIKAYQHD